MPRRWITWVTVLWLCSQAATVVAAAQLHCRDHHHGARDDHACCRRAGGPDLCPEHGTPPGHADAHGAHAAPATDDDAAAGEHAHHPATAASAPATSKPASEPSHGMSCACRASDAAFAGLTIGTGLLPPSFLLPFDLVIADVTARHPRAAGRLFLPDTPPPRR